MPDIRIRWSDNTADLARNLKEGLNQIEATRASAEKMVQSLSGDKLIRAAHNYTAAVQQMGGAEKLTVAEKERINALLTKAIEKYTLLGRVAPEALRTLAQQTRITADASKQMVDGMSAIGAKSLESQKLITGMGQAGTQAMTGIATGAASTVGPMQTLLGLARTIGPVLGVSFGVGAIVGFTKEVFASADALTKMSDRTGIGVEGLQRLQVVGDDAGNTIEQLTGAVNMMQRRLADGDASALGALTKLGLKFEDIRRMDPDQQFMAIGDAIRAIKDPADQVNLAMDLFGRSGAEILPSIKRGFDDVRDASIGMSAGATKAIDDLGDAIGRLWRQSKSMLGEAVGQSIIAIGGLATAAVPGRVTLGGQAQQESADLLTQTYARLAKGVADTIPPIEHLGVTSAQQAAIERDLAERTKTTTREREKAVTAINKQEEANTSAYLSELAMGRQALMTSESLRGLSVSGGLIADSFQAAQQRMAAFTATTKEAVTFDLSGFFEMGRITPPAMTDFKQTFGTSVAGLAQSMPSLLIKSFTGGGGLKGAAQAIGTTFGQNLFGANGAFAKTTQSLTGGLSKVLGSTIGGALGAAIPGVGALIGPAIEGLGKLFGKIFGGPSQAELDTRALQAKLVDALRSVATEGQKTEGALSSNYETIAIVARDAFLKTGLSAQEAQEKVRALLDTKNPERFKAAMEDLQSAMSLQKTAQDALTEALSRYKFSLQELGPALRAQKLNEQAQSLLKDWQVLTQAGIDVAAVGREMQGSINAFLRDAITTGTEVDVALKPMLQRMAEMGLLTDAAGNKIDNLEAAGVSFSLSMSDGFKAVVTEVKRLTDAIRLSLGLAIENVPDIDVDVNYHDPGFHPDFEAQPLVIKPEFAARGGLVTPQGVQTFARGGIVQPQAPFQHAGVAALSPVRYLATGGAIFQPRGTDTVPAMLTVGEEVTSTQDRSTFIAGLAALQREMRELVTRLGDRRDLIAQLDGREFLRITNRILDNGGTVRTEMRDALGVT